MRENETVRRFQASMPPTYSEAFSGTEIAEHARIAAERRGSQASVVPLRRLPDGQVVFCVVANDFPGLVAAVSGAFLELGLDIRSAQIFSRQPAEGGVEAVDFFWVRARPGSTALLEAEESAQRIAAVVNGTREASFVGPVPRLRKLSSEARVAFSPSKSTGRDWLLLVQARDEPGLLHRITRTLGGHGLEILESEVVTSEGTAHDRFLVRSCSAEDLAPQRIERVTEALLEAIAATHEP